MIQLLDHTADVGFELEADSLSVLFEEAHRALLTVMLESFPKDGAEKRLVEISAPDLEILLVRWLNELIYLIQDKGLVPLSKKPPRVAEGGALQAQLSCAPLDLEEHGWRGEVKAATFHGLKVNCGELGWSARVILDV